MKENPQKEHLEIAFSAWLRLVETQTMLRYLHNLREQRMQVAESNVMGNTITDNQIRLLVTQSLTIKEIIDYVSNPTKLAATVGSK